MDIEPQGSLLRQLNGSLIKSSVLLKPVRLALKIEVLIVGKQVQPFLEVSCQTEER